MGLCASKDAKLESNSLRKCNTNTSTTKDKNNLSTQRAGINDENACDLPDNKPETAKSTTSSTDKCQQSLSPLNYDEKSQQNCCDNPVHAQNIAEDVFPLEFNKTAPTTQTIESPAKHNNEAVETFASHTIWKLSKEANLQNIEMTKNLSDNGSRKKENTKEHIIWDDYRFPNCEIPGIVEKFTSKRHSSNLVHDLAKKSRENLQVEEEIKMTAFSLDKEKQKMTIEQKPVSFVKERVKELERKLLSTKSATINQAAVHRVSRNLISSVTTDKEDHLSHTPNLSTSNDVDQLDNLKYSTANSKNDAQDKSCGNRVNDTENSVKTHMKTCEEKNRRVRRSRNSLARASTVFSTETLSKFLDTYSRDTEIENSTVITEAEAQEKFIEDSLIATLKRTDSSPGVDLNSEIAVKRWKYSWKCFKSAHFYENIHVNCSKRLTFVETRRNPCEIIGNRLRFRFVCILYVRLVLKYSTGLYRKFRYRTEHESNPLYEVTLQKHYPDFLKEEQAKLKWISHKRKLNSEFLL
ncbi:hypothetical protein Gasu2_39590 [Galdieria sulphuraria]|nr:hypothetical protein Gasu2_39590 [Galdieria sulphuraria]